jgi:hypothetical protein
MQVAFEGVWKTKWDDDFIKFLSARIGGFVICPSWRPEIVHAIYADETNFSIVEFGPINLQIRREVNVKPVVVSYYGKCFDEVCFWNDVEQVK